MERTPDHNTNTNFDHAEKLPVSPDGPERIPSKAPIRGVPKPLFITVAVAAVVFGGLFAWLALRTESAAQYEFKLERQLDSQEAVSVQLQQELEQTRTALAKVQDELAQARNAIGLLEEYSIAAPDGSLPEYTQLYPDLYAPAWEGEVTDGGRVCCLTFDDGPSANTDRVLEILDRYNVKATFFVVGRTGEADQERMRKIVTAGHTIAMHSWSHNYRTLYASVESFLAEFNDLYQWIYEVTGTYPQVYRFPGGSINGYDRGVYQEIIAEMTRRGFVYFDWNASAQDATAKPRPAADIAADCLKGVGRDLVVVLSHDSAARGTTADALPAVIEGYQAAGYTFAALNPGVRPITFGYPVSQ